MSAAIYERIGATPIINARGPYTILGGSRISPRVWAAMEDANRRFVLMADLLDASGRIVAEAIGAEAARITPGATSGLVLAVAACMAGTDPERQARLPDSSGMPNEVVIQHGQRYHWDKMAGMAGARLVVAGDADGVTTDQLSAALHERTAAVLVPGHLAGRNGTLSLPETAALAHARGVPVIVDAAFLSFPWETFREILDQGAALAIFSAKYFGGPNTGGFVCGRKQLVDVVAQLDFTAHGPDGQISFGRAFKLDRQLVAGVVEALHEWRDMDHGARLEGYEQLVGRLAGALRDVPGITLTPMHYSMEETLQAEPINCLVVRVDPAPGRSAVEIEARLAAGSPSVLLIRFDDQLALDVECLTAEEAAVLGRRLREELTNVARTA